MRTKGAHKAISKALKGKQPAPMAHLERTFDQGLGKPKGSIATCPDDVFSILHHTWGPITDGNSSDPAKQAKQFIGKYRSHIVMADEFQLSDITVEQFKAQCQRDVQSAPGLDGWSADDLELLSDHAYKLMVDMLNSIERGNMWPKAMQATRAVFLAKDASNTKNPLAYRILKITSGVYRKYGSMRMHHLHEWIEQWDEDAIHAGVPGKSAFDGWYKTAIDIEYARANKQPSPAVQ